jgi:hypothetical protein
MPDDGWAYDQSREQRCNAGKCSAESKKAEDAEGCEVMK